MTDKTETYYIFLDNSMTSMETITTAVSRKQSHSPSSSSASSSATTASITPPLLTRGVSYHSVTSIPNLLNYDGQASSQIRSERRPAHRHVHSMTINTSSNPNINTNIHNNFGTSSSVTGLVSLGSSPRSPLHHGNYQYGTRHQTSESLDFLADTAIDQNMNQEEFKRILQKLSDFSTQLRNQVANWELKSVGDVQMNDLSKLATETRSVLKNIDRLLELKSINEWSRKKPQLPSINQLRNELQKPMVEFQFPSRPATKNVYNVIVRNNESHIPSASVSTTREKPSAHLGHKVSKSEGSIIGTTHTFKVDKMKAKKRNSVSHQRKISIAAGDGTESCKHCHETVTPEWRRGPYGNRTLCNACGLFYCKLVRKFSSRDANILMHYRKANSPEDRRVPENLNVPEAFVESLKKDSSLDENFNVKPNTLR